MVRRQRIDSGKSTVLRLLAGLHRPSEGLVDVDGMDLRQVDPADFRARVGFVSQARRLFNGTLRDNVLLDHPGADLARLAGVARLTGLDRLVAQHPQGWELPVSEAGNLLWGGSGSRWRRRAVWCRARASCSWASPPARWTRRARLPSCAGSR